jgi:hypothetical protein
MALAWWNLILFRSTSSVQEGWLPKKDEKIAQIQENKRDYIQWYSFHCCVVWSPHFPNRWAKWKSLRFRFVVNVALNKPYNVLWPPKVLQMYDLHVKACDTQLLPAPMQVLITKEHPSSQSILEGFLSILSRSRHYKQRISDVNKLLKWCKNMIRKE